MKKKTLAVLLAIILVLAASACDNAPKTTVTTEEDTSKTVQTSSGTGEDGAVVASTTSQSGSDSNQDSKASGTASKTSPSTEIPEKRGAPTVIDDNDSANTLTMNKFTYTGSWSHGDDSKCYNATASWIWMPGAYYELKFTGVQFEIYAGPNVMGGISLVYIDGEFIEECDTYGPYPMNARENELIYKSKMLSPGEHTIKIVNSGRQNDKCEAKEPGKALIGVDRIIVYAAP